MGKPEYDFHDEADVDESFDRGAMFASSVTTRLQPGICGWQYEDNRQRFSFLDFSFN